MDRETLHKASRLSAQIDAYESYIHEIDYSMEDAKELVINVRMPGSMLDTEIDIADKNQVSFILQTLRDIFSAEVSAKEKELEEL